MYFFIVVPITVVGWSMAALTSKLYAEDKPLMALVVSFFNPYHLCVIYASYKIYESLFS